MYIDSNIFIYAAIDNGEKGYNFERFIGDRKTQDAIIRNIEIIGEAVKNISEN